MIYKIFLLILLVTVIFILLSTIYTITVPYPNKYTDGLVKVFLYALVIELGVITIVFLFFGV